MTIFDTICKWTSEERQLFTPLIKECLKRETEIAVNRELSIRGLKRVHDHLVGGLIEREVKRWHTA